MENTAQEKKKKTNYAHLFRLCHWLLGAGIIFLIFTGYGIYSVSMPAWSIFDHYPSFFPGIRAIYWHKVIAIIFAPAAIISLIFFLRNIKTMKLNNLRRIATILLLGSAVVCVITSLGLLYTVPAWIYHISRFLHAVCGMIIAPVALLIHLYLALFKYFPLLIQSFAPFRQSRWVHVIWFFIGLILSWGLFTRFVNYHSGLNDLTAIKITESVTEAKQVDSLPWDKASPLNARLVNGVGFDFGVTDASVKALYNDEYVYMKIEWRDHIYNRTYRDWIKTETGWIQLNPGGSDEIIYNEDKVALLFPINTDRVFRQYGCAIYCHNNQKTGRGQHWSTVDNPLDMWHWKSVRMDPMGYVDDKYWQMDGDVDPSKEARIADPGDGGHANNKVKGVNNPIMLPSTVDAIVMGALVHSKSEIYTKAAAEKFPVGFAVPGVIISFTAEGDRADIKCYSTYDYDNEKWILRIMRKMDTGSEHDVIFKQGQKYDFTVVAFDHNSNRHSYNHQAYRLYFQQ